MNTNIKLEKIVINKEIAKLHNTNNVNKVEMALINILEAVNNLKGYIVNVEEELVELIRVRNSEGKEELLKGSKGNGGSRELGNLFDEVIAEMACL